MVLLGRVLAFFRQQSVTITSSYHVCKVTTQLLIKSNLSNQSNHQHLNPNKHIKMNTTFALVLVLAICALMAAEGKNNASLNKLVRRRELHPHGKGTKAPSVGKGTKAPKAPSSKAPKSPSTKMPKTPSSKAPKAPSSKAPKSPKTTKAPVPTTKAPKATK